MYYILLYQLFYCYNKNQNKLITSSTYNIKGEKLNYIDQVYYYNIIKNKTI
jgi:hypothetical protein